MAKKKVLIGYHTKDRQFAFKNLKKAAELSDDQVMVWTEQDLTPDRRERRERDLDDVSVAVLFLSENFLSSVPDVSKLVATLVESIGERNVIPVYSREVTTKSQLEPFERLPHRVFPTDDRALLTLGDKEQQPYFDNLAEHVGRLRDSGYVDVFISYDHNDRDFAELLCAKIKLDNPDIEVWLDSDISPGTMWQQEIDSAIESSSVVVCVLTPEASESPYVTYEWSYALGAGKDVLPIVRVQANLHPVLEQKQHFDFTANQRDWKEVLRRIKDAIDAS